MLVYGYLVGAGWVYRVGNTGSRGTTQPPRARDQGTPDQRSGPRKPLLGGWSGWVWGGGPVPFACPRVRPPIPLPTLRARSVPEAPPWQGARLLGQKGRDSMTFTLKLVKTAKCHQKVSIRPPLLPISKTGSGIHLLKFQDFHICQPSLPRN